MPTRNLLLGVGFALVLGITVMAFAQNEAASTPAENIVPGTTLDAKKIEGTVVIKSSEEVEEDAYADEETEEESTEATSSLQISRNPVTGLLTVDAPGEDIRSVLRQVADLYSLNIVVPENLNGVTTLKLREVTWKQLFEVMLNQAGFSYVEDGNILLIKSREEISAEPTETRVFLINYASAGDLSASIAPLVDASTGGRVQVDRRSNALVITERPSRFNNIKDIIERLDRATPQVIIESKFIEITDNDAKNLGLDWQSLNAYELSASDLGRTWTREADSDTITDMTDTAVFSASDFNVVLSALQTLTPSKLISNPTVVALNNTEANINIGEEYPIPEYSYNQEQGVFEVSGFSYKPIGINLKVNPQVNSQGYITLTIAPEVSSRTGEVSFGGSSGAKIPIIATRKTSSTISIKDGYTLAIGGLIETKDNTTVVKVPLLGDLPVAGNLFKSESYTKDRRNLLIFITARTINADGSGKDVFDPRVITEMGITDSDLPGYKPTEEEGSLYKAIDAKRETEKRKAQLKSLRKTLDPEAAVKEKRKKMDVSSRRR